MDVLTIGAFRKDNGLHSTISPTKLMKVLYILRHAKSSWDDVSLADFDRPLNDRGLKTAPFMGSFMEENGFVPEMIVSSPAKRAARTAELVAEKLGQNIPIDFDERIYDASSAELVAVISKIPKNVSSAMLVGHNPGMEGIVYRLTAEDVTMPTAALARIEMDIDEWNDAADGNGRLTFFGRPKELLGLRE